MQAAQNESTVAVGPSLLSALEYDRLLRPGLQLVKKGLTSNQATEKIARLVCRHRCMYRGLRGDKVEVGFTNHAV
jgi:hypothetical protein